jgi:hypothetical protein
VLVLVAEGRRYGCDDFDGQHDIVAKRSSDGGRRWGALQVVADPAKELNCTSGSLVLPRCEFWDPTVLYDSSRCEVLVMSAYASANSSTRGGGIQDIFLFRSSDQGASWSAPRNISTMLSATKGARYHVSTANGHGMQIRAPSPWAGRLIVPAYGVVSTFTGRGGPWGSSVYYSDNFGRSWNKSADFSPGSAEGEVVQIPGSRDLLANLRNINGSYNCGALSNGMCRVTARSTCVANAIIIVAAADICGACRPPSTPPPLLTLCTRVLRRDGGVTWHGVARQPSQRDPSCKAGIAAWPPADPTVILFANADNNVTRTNITLWVHSLDAKPMLWRRVPHPA